jgi:hypothetical protein
MTTTKDIQKFYHRLMELKGLGYGIDIYENTMKNYVSYTISKSSGNAKYEDCVIMYNGEESTDEEEYEDENVCRPQDIPTEDLLTELEDIVSTINKVFSK